MLFVILNRKLYLYAQRGKLQGQGGAPGFRLAVYHLYDLFVRQSGLSAANL